MAALKPTAPSVSAPPAVSWRSSSRSPEQTRALDEVGARVAAAVIAAESDPLPVVTFDLDSTLFDNRPRQKAILSEFAKVHRLSGVERIPIEEIDGWRLIESIDRLDGIAGREEALRAAFKPFWRDRFFTSEFCRFDVALPGASDFVLAVARAGAQIVYLTGRHEGMKQGTADSLAEWHFPAASLMVKPTFEMSDTQWKEVAVAKIRAMGPVVACFDNETTHVNRLKTAFPEALVVWLRTDHSPEAESLPPGTPGIDGFLR